MLHTASLRSLLCKQSSLLAGNLDSEPFPASLRDLDRPPLAAMDLMQHRLAGDAEPLRRLVQREEAFGDVRDEAPPDLV